MPCIFGGTLVGFMKRFFSVMAIESLVCMILCTCTFAPENANATVESEPEAISQEVIDGLRDTQELMKEKVSIYEANRKEMAQKQESDETAEQEQVRETEQDQENSSEEESEEFSWDGEVITPSSGVANGPSGFETYYNLPMGGVVSIMRGLGYDEANYPYWVRDDGCKMLGSYIMVAANLDIRPYGTVLPCSRGMAIVCDTGTFAASNPYQLDIAVSW